jgi:hypothetical protein
VHAEGDRVVLPREGVGRKEIVLARVPGAAPATVPPPATPDGSPAQVLPEPPTEVSPGGSQLDAELRALTASLGSATRSEP